MQYRTNGIRDATGIGSSSSSKQRVQRRGRLDDCLETGVSAAIVIVGR
jgi:hypothetical protein